jgi:DNA-binding GntR family transcriptional regulator
MKKQMTGPKVRTAGTRAASRVNEAAPIARRALHGEVVQRIRDLIVQGELAPGERVPERELCERFGISRTPFREALKVLATEGLIDLQHHRGAVVSKVTAGDVDDMFQVMGVLEALAGKLACRRASDAEIAAVEKFHERMLRHYREHDLSSYFQFNQRIHEAIMQAAGNPVLVNMYGTLSVRIRRARYMANLSQARWDQAVAEHEEILDALKARDGERLGRLLRDHLLHKADVIKAVLLGA